MMGFGGMGMTVPWLFGVVALATIWAGVWWMLSAVGITRRVATCRRPRQQRCRPPRRGSNRNLTRAAQRRRQRPKSQISSAPRASTDDLATPA